MHDIDTTTGKAAFAHAGKPAWHRLGQQLTAGATIEQWQSESGLSYAVRAATVQYQSEHGIRGMPGRVVLYRDDTGAPLGVVSDGYNIVQPGAVLEFYRDLCESRGFALETAGALKGGAIYWALARVGDPAQIAGDRHQPYLLLSSSADGSRATDARFTAVRVVCANTMAVAMSAGNDAAVRTTHRAKFSAAATKKALGIVDFAGSWQQYAEQLRALASMPIDQAEATAIFSDLLRPATDRAPDRQHIGADSLDALLQGGVRTGRHVVQTDKARAIRGLADLEHSYLHAPGAVPGTAYGVLQAVTHYVDHARGADQDKRQVSAQFGQGADLKQTAFERLLARATA